MRKIAKDLFYYSGIAKFLISFLRFRKCAKLLIITYHKVYPSSGGRQYLGVSKEEFEKHIRFIKDNFEIVSMRDGLRILSENNRKGIYVAINFDDGYMDNYLYAYPILKKYSVPVTLFLTTDFIGKEHIFWWDKVVNIVNSLKTDSLEIVLGSNKYCFKLNGLRQRDKVAKDINMFLMTKSHDEICRLVEKLEKKFLRKAIKPCVMLGWDEIIEMSKSGVHFGAHTKTHRNLCQLNAEEIRKELIDSKREIEERLGTEVLEFAYPFGIFNERVKEIVKDAGFKCARTTLKGVNYRKRDDFLLNSITGEMSANHLMATISFNLSGINNVRK